MRSTALVVVFLCMLFLSACRIEIENPFPDAHSYTKSRIIWETPGTYVEERLVAYMEDVFSRYAPNSEKKFTDLSVEFTALAPRPEVTPSAITNSFSRLPNPKDPLPPNNTATQWWWEVPGWRLEPPNKAIISYYFDGWEFESVLGASFAAFAAGESARTAFPAGITVSDTLNKRLAHLWDETKICTGFPDGEFSDLAVYLMPPTFLCGDQMGGGCYETPNTVQINNRGRVTKHEFIHYILWVNTGDANGTHTNPLFQSCTQ